jgi:hypothetical protein
MRSAVGVGGLESLRRDARVLLGQYLDRVAVVEAPSNPASGDPRAADEWLATLDFAVRLDPLVAQRRIAHSSMSISPELKRRSNSPPLMPSSLRALSSTSGEAVCQTGPHLGRKP